MTDSVSLAMQRFRVALAAYSRWPWSRRRQFALVAALSDVLDAHARAVQSQAAAVLTGPLETLRAHQGRHEQRIDRLERERERAMEVGK